MKISTSIVIAAFHLCLAATGLLAKEIELSDPRYLSMANNLLSSAGLPRISAKAKNLQCYAWRGNSCGIYATFVLKDFDMTQYLAMFPTSMHSESPIPENLLAPPNATAPWFAPGSITKGSILWRERTHYGSPYTFRLYIDGPNSRVFLYYSWKNKEADLWGILEYFKFKEE